MLPFRQLAAPAWRCALLWCGLFAAAQAHDTIYFDPSAPSQFSINGTWGQSTPIVLHGIAKAILRPDGMEIELTMADGAAYKLLNPAQMTSGTANATTDVSDAQFAKDEPLFIERARTFFKVENNGKQLGPGSATVELTPARDTIFRLIFPPPLPGSLHLEITYLGQIPAGEKDLVTVLDRDDATLASATLGKDSPALEVTVPAPESVPVGTQAGANHKLIFIISALTVAAVLALLHKLRKPELER